MTDSDEKKTAYDKILHETLMQRTGRNFKKNLDQAPAPQVGERLKGEDAAHLIFDNILKKREERKQRMLQTEEQPAGPASSPESTGHSGYAEILDSILWPEETPAAQAQNLQHTVIERPVSPPVPPAARAQAAGVPASRPAVPPAVEPNPVLSQTFASTLDSILEFSAAPPPAPPRPLTRSAKELERMTQTQYNQQLDEILWPSEVKK